MRQLPSGKYQVRTPNEVHAKAASFANAMAQRRLLNAVDHGWVPTGRKGKKKKKKSQPD
jgi:hypothetical protein